MVMSPNILEVMSFWLSTRVTATVVYCILTQILCVVSRKKLQLLGDLDLLPGLCPEPRWGTSSPRPPTGAPPLDPTGGLCSTDPLPGLRRWSPQTPSLLL